MDLKTTRSWTGGHHQALKTLVGWEQGFDGVEGKGQTLPPTKNATLVALLQIQTGALAPVWSGGGSVPIGSHKFS